MNVTPPPTPAPSLAILNTFLASHPIVKYIRYEFIDYGNHPRGRVVTVSRAIEMASDPDPSKTSGVSTGSYVLYYYTNFGASTLDSTADGDDHWVPDWETLRPAAGNSNHAVVFCHIKEAGEDEVDWYARDPRKVLQRVTKKASERGLDFLVGVEIEFLLLPSADADGPIAMPSGAWTTASFRHPSFTIVERVVESLESVGISVWCFQQENSSGQYEISLSPTDPDAAIDNLVYAHETIKTLAARQGLHATMHPRPFERGCTTGQHFHISFTERETDTGSGDQFLAGLLEHLPALTAFTMAGYDSHGCRDKYIGNGDVTWGRTKMNSPIRRFEDTYYEIRTPDCLGNPYLQLAAILTAGLHGVSSEMPLTMRPNTWDRSEPMAPALRAELGVTASLPRNLIGALDALREDYAVFEEGMGEKCVEAYMRCKRVEEVLAGQITSTERRKAIVANI